MAGVRAYELRTKSKEELQSQLVELKKELANLNVQKLTKSSLPRIHTVKKDIAKVLTVMNLNQREAVKALYAGKKYQPKGLRGKKTRAIRRRLTKYETGLKTLKQEKKEKAFPVKKYAIKA